jgi:hypothetical protein
MESRSVRTKAKPPNTPDYEYGSCLLEATSVSRNVAEASRYSHCVCRFRQSQRPTHVRNLPPVIAGSMTGYFRYLNLSGEKYDGELSRFAARSRISPLFPFDRESCHIIQLHWGSLSLACKRLIACRYRRRM